MMRLARSLWRNVDGAIAPLTGLALFGLIAAGGVAFDYARLAGMDTELQQAADQAALAAATQLDRSDDSQTRATTAIEDPDNTHRLASNLTRFANDGNGTGVTIDSIKFCSAFDDSIADTDTACTETNDGTTSQFVIVTTEIRTADYAFTPIVAAFRGNSQASAVAGVASSICNVAPLLVCAPNDDFPTDADIGKGIIMKVAGGNQWVPGNYGYLDFGNGNQAVLNALMGFGLNGCQEAAATQTEPGDKNATDAINTRMDVYSGSGATKDASVCKADGTGCPAKNTRKDMAVTMTYVIQQKTSLGQPTAPNCGTAETGKGNPNPSVTYSTSFALANTASPAAVGFARDTCHYSGTCAGGNFGDGNWNRADYLAANHPGVTAATIASDLGGAANGVTAAGLTRYQIYQWELDHSAPPANPSNAMDPQEIGVTPPPTKKVNGTNTTWTFTKQCTFSKPFFATTNYPAQKDRRVLPIVAADCSDLKGKGTAFVDFKILRVFDVFLTEPSEKRTSPPYPGNQGTDPKEIYGEVIGPAQTFAGSNGFQFFARNKPYLVR